MRIHTRLGLSVCLTVFSLVCIVLLLPRSRVGSRLQKIALASSIDNYWDWGTDAVEGIEGGVRLVVFGDSWVDNTIENGEEGKGRSWTEVLCDEINCSSYLNFGVSQPSKSYPTSPPTGAISSNHIYTSSAPESPGSAVVKMLPDLAAQVDKFLSLPLPESQPDETFFIVSFGIWDIYKLASLDFFMGQQAIAQMIPEIFIQIDKLYSHYTKSVGDPTKSRSSNDTEEIRTRKPPFQVIVPKLFDPTLLPGWLSQRPVPLRPSSIAEQQKNGMYLTNLWNAILENKIGEWLQNNASDTAKPNVEGKQTEQRATSEKKSNVVDKDIFFYDLPRYLLDIIVEHDLEVAGLSDGQGLGKGESPFVQVYQPCVLDTGNGIEEGFVEQNGQLICKAPNEYLFWDSFNLGSIAKEGIGKEVGEMIAKKESMKNIWKGEKGFWGTV